MTTEIDILPFVIRADDVEGPRQGQWTYADYAALTADNEWYEIVDGVLYMSPAPNTSHQEAIALFVTYLTIHVQFAGIGRVYPAPCDVELHPDFVVQPDVIVVLNDNLGIITPSHIVGAPDLVVEIASPSTAGYDRRTKQDAYAEAGVREYWIADASAQTVEVLALEGRSYQTLGVFRGQATLPSRVLPELPIKVAQLFG